MNLNLKWNINVKNVYHEEFAHSAGHLIGQAYAWLGSALM